MKFTTPERLDYTLFREKILGRELMPSYYSNSRFGSGAPVSLIGLIKDEVKNPDGSYTYEYISQKIYDVGHDIIEKNPYESERDLEEMVEELLFSYNIHEFKTELQDKPNNIKDYYADITVDIEYAKSRDMHKKSSWSHHRKDDGKYANPDESGLSSFFSNAISLEITDINEIINYSFEKTDVIRYLMNRLIRKNYRIRLGLDEIDEFETVDEYISKLTFSNPEYNTFDEALESGIITRQDIENYIENNSYINGKLLPHDIVEETLQKQPNLISRFDLKKLPADLMKKYDPNFNIMKIEPSELQKEDFESVIEGINRYNTSSNINLSSQYLKYFAQFYDDPEKIKKIILCIDSNKEIDGKEQKPPFSQNEVKLFVSAIPEDVISAKELRDYVLDCGKITPDRILAYDFEYDKLSSKKLLQVLGNCNGEISFSQFNTIIEIAKNNGIENDEILNSLEQNGFSIGDISTTDIEKFKQLGIKGITLDHIRDLILDKKDFRLINIADNADQQDITRFYNSCINELQEINGKKQGQESKKYEEIYKLTTDFDNVNELFSRMTQEEKEKTKKQLIDNLDLIEQLQKKDNNSLRSFWKVMDVMSKSFNLSDEDLINIYTKCLNNGRAKAYAIQDIKGYINEKDKRDKFEQSVNSANIYPNPKYNWLSDSDSISLRVPRGENRSTIKSKIQSDGRCFSTKLKTDMEGMSTEGKSIPVNNLSKWLFGVPGARGNLVISKNGQFIKLPSSTPDEAIELISSLMIDKTRNNYRR